MARLFLTALDLNKNELQNAVVQQLAAAPGSPVQGQLYYNTGDDNFYVYDGAAWVDLTQQAGGGFTTAGAGLTSTGVTVDVGAGTGITVAADTVGIDTAVVPRLAVANTFTVAQIIDLAAAGTPLTLDTGADGQNILVFTEGGLARGKFVETSNNLELNAQNTLRLTSNASLIDVASSKVQNLLDPTVAQDAATKNYVDSVAQGLDAKPSVRCASTAPVNLAGGVVAIDGITPTSGQRVLLKNQSAPADNGTYQWTGAAWVRGADMDAWTEVPGAYVWVEEGTTQADTGWVCTSDQGGTLGTTAINWTQFTGGAAITAGTGLTKTGNSLDAIAGLGIVVGADDIGIDTAIIPRKNQVNTFTLGQTIDLSAGGNVLTLDAGAAGQRFLEFSQGAAARGNIAEDTGSITIQSSSTLKLDPAASSPVDVVTSRIVNVVDPSAAQDAATKNYVDTNAAKKFAVSIGDGSSTAITVTHNLGTKDCIVQVYDNNTPFAQVECDVAMATTNTVTVTFAVAPASNRYRCVVHA